jgi:hypothetical protein
MNGSCAAHTLLPMLLCYLNFTGSYYTRTWRFIEVKMVLTSSFLRTASDSAQRGRLLTMASISDQGSLRIISRSNSSSSNGHISPLQEASTLLFPGQLHRDSPVQERDTPAIVEAIEDGSETQPSLCPISAPSNPSSTREEKDARPTFFRHATHWRTVRMIIGFLFAG